MTSVQVNQVSGVLQRMRMRSSLTPSQHRLIDSLAQPAWPHEFAALAKLWRGCPDLVEQYLDVVISVLHEFPKTGLDTSPAANGNRASATHLN